MLVWGSVDRLNGGRRMSIAPIRVSLGRDLMVNNNSNNNNNNNSSNNSNNNNNNNN